MNRTSTFDFMLNWVRWGMTRGRYRERGASARAAAPPPLRRAGARREGAHVGAETHASRRDGGEWVGAAARPCAGSPTGELPRACAAERGGGATRRAGELDAMRLASCRLLKPGLIGARALERGGKAWRLTTGPLSDRRPESAGRDVPSPRGGGQKRRDKEQYRRESFR